MEREVPTPPSARLSPFPVGATQLSTRPPLPGQVCVGKLLETRPQLSVWGEFRGQAATWCKSQQGSYLDAALGKYTLFFSFGPECIYLADLVG